MDLRLSIWMDEIRRSKAAAYHVRTNNLSGVWLHEWDDIICDLVERSDAHPNRFVVHGA